MFKFGKRSERELKGVHPDLVAVCRKALEISFQDFGVFDGLRTAEEQAEHVASGASQAKFSKHQVQADGYGHAVDLVPYIAGKYRWEWDAVYVVAHAVQVAARELNVPLRWGGAWHVDNFAESSLSQPQALNKEYNELRRSQGRKAFNDGPHFELAEVYRPAFISFLEDDTKCEPSKWWQPSLPFNL